MLLSARSSRSLLSVQQDSSELSETRARLAAALEALGSATAEAAALRDRARTLEAQVAPAAAPLADGSSVLGVARLATPSCAEFHRAEREAAERLQEENEALQSRLRVAVGTVAALEAQLVSAAQQLKRFDAERERAVAEAVAELSARHNAEVLELQRQTSEQEKALQAAIKQLAAERDVLVAEIAELRRPEAAEEQQQQIRHLQHELSSLAAENRRLASELHRGSLAVPSASGASSSAALSGRPQKSSRATTTTTAAASAAGTRSFASVALAGLAVTGTRQGTPPVSPSGVGRGISIQLPSPVRHPL